MKITISIREGHKHILSDVFKYVQTEIAKREVAFSKWQNMASNNSVFEPAMISIDFHHPPIDHIRRINREEKK